MTGSPVASARKLAEAPVPPLLERLPATRAVSGVPELAVKVPFSVQPENALVFQPPLRKKPWMPTGEESM